jgi:hypothetical protein
MYYLTSVFLWSLINSQEIYERWKIRSTSLCLEWTGCSPLEGRENVYNLFFIFNLHFLWLHLQVLKNFYMNKYV